MTKWKKKDDHPIWSRKRREREEKKREREKKSDHKGKRVYERALSTIQYGQVRGEKEREDGPKGSKSVLMALSKEKCIECIFIKGINIFPFISNLIAY